MQQLRCLQQRPRQLGAAPSCRSRGSLRARVARPHAAGGSASTAAPAPDAASAKGAAVRRYEGVAYEGKLPRRPLLAAAFLEALLAASARRRAHDTDG
jgi:hypothetical protein